MDFQNIIISISALANLFLGLFILSRGKQKLVNQVYAILAFSIFFWSLGMVLYRASIKPEIAFLWCRFLYAFAIIMAGSFLYFTTIFPNKRSESRLSYLLSIFFVLSAILTLTTNWIIKGVIIPPLGEHKIVFGALYHIVYSMIISGSFLWGYINLIRTRLTSIKIVKSQINYIFLGAFLSSGFGMISNLILPSLGDFRFNWLGQVLAILMAGFMAYAIIRYRLMGIELIASKVYVSLFLAIFTQISFYFILYLNKITFNNFYSLPSLIFSFIYALIFSGIFIAVLEKLRESGDQIFFNGRNPRKAVKDIIIKLSGTIYLQEIIQLIQEEFSLILKNTKTQILVFKNNENSKINKSNFIISPNQDIYSADPILSERLLKNLTEIVATDELIINRKNPHLRNELKKHNIAIVAPLKVHDKLIGALLLNDKNSGGAYTKENIEFIETLSPQIATVLENANLHAEVENFNKDLQKKIDLQTKDIQAKSERLQKLMTMRGEFLDITSHQLRTPVSVIKGVLSMLEAGDVPRRKIKEFISMAFNKSLKLEEIVDEILIASEMDSEKFNLKLSPCDLTDLLKRIYEEKEPLAKRRGLDLILDLPKKLPRAKSDLKYLKHVIINLVNNALQYTIKGSITISARAENGKIVITVSDTGIGIPKKDKGKLFSKFSRADNARNTYTDGSGLGLYIVRKIMEAHRGGSVKIKKTEVGKGTIMEVKVGIY